MSIIFLHPLPLDGSVWDEVAAQCEGELVVVPSLYQLGESMRAWAAAVIDLLPPGSHTIVGNSVGASCAVEVAYLASARVSRLVLVGGKISHRPEPSLRDEAVRLLSEMGLASAWDGYWRPLFGPMVGAGSVEVARRTALAQSVEDVIRGVCVFHGREDRSDLHEFWRGRLDVVSGEHDRAPSIAAASAALDHAERGCMHVLHDVGHYVPIEAPGRLASIIADPAVHNL